MKGGEGYLEGSTRGGLVKAHFCQGKEVRGDKPPHAAAAAGYIGPGAGGLRRRDLAARPATALVVVVVGLVVGLPRGHLRHVTPAHPRLRCARW